MDYADLIEGILTAHQESFAAAATAVNQALVLRNWLIGAYVVEFEQGGADRARYGIGLLANLSRDLRAKSVPGCSAEMLGRMRAFYRTFPQLRERACVRFDRLPSEVGPHAEISSPSMTESAARKSTSLSPLQILRLCWAHWIELLYADRSRKNAVWE